MSLTVFEGINDVRSWVAHCKQEGNKVGFVPTMGALHRGHVSLIAEAKRFCDRVVVSVFVNPTQFNNPDDLLKYPRNIQKDMEILEEAGCDALFHPSVNEMYPEKSTGHWDFGSVTQTLEAHFRPGHFDGVLTIVKKLFEAVNPDYAFFGEKDFQQLTLIRKMTEFEGLPVQVVACPSVREPNGLAMSSRNMRLTYKELEDALAISRVLFQMKIRSSQMTPEELLEWAHEDLKSAKGIRLEYIDIVNTNSFEHATQWKPGERYVALIAAYVGEVRLIDNVIFDQFG